MASAADSCIMYADDYYANVTYWIDLMTVA